MQKNDLYFSNCHATLWRQAGATCCIEKQINKIYILLRFIPFLKIWTFVSNFAGHAVLIYDPNYYCR
jgi:hypothetical protein